VVVEVAIGVGAYVPQGAPLFRVWGAADGLDTAELRRGAIFAEERTHALDARRPALEDHLARLDRAVETAYPDPEERAHARTADHIGIGGPGH
jgi:hypothetical protein